MPSLHNRYVRISLDGKILLNTIRNAETSIQEAIFYNMYSGEEIHMPLPNKYRFQGWLPDGRVKYGNVVERKEDTGEIRETLTLDPITQQTEESVNDLVLSDFAFNDSEIEQFGLFYGYEAIDPMEQLILYSAQSENEGDYEIRLHDLQTGKTIWYHESKHLSSSVPQWSMNSDRVLFNASIPIANSHDVWWKIISLTRDGQAEELPSQPFPIITKGELNHYSRSLDGRYLFYTALVIDVKNISTINRAFIVDTISGEVGEICDPDSTFIASVPASSDVEGYWLPNGQFLYRTLIDIDGQPTHSLRILDIPSWTSQVVFEPESGQGVNIFGWTPFESPNISNVMECCAQVVYLNHARVGLHHGRYFPLAPVSVLFLGQWGCWRLG